MTISFLPYFCAHLTHRFLRPTDRHIASIIEQLNLYLFSYNFLSSDVFPTVRNFFLGHKLGR